MRNPFHVKQLQKFEDKIQLNFHLQGNKQLDTTLLQVIGIYKFVNTEIEETLHLNAYEVQ